MGVWWTEEEGERFCREDGGGVCWRGRHLSFWVHQVSKTEQSQKVRWDGSKKKPPTWQFCQDWPWEQEQRSGRTLTTEEAGSRSHGSRDLGVWTPQKYTLGLGRQNLISIYLSQFDRPGWRHVWFVQDTCHSNTIHLPNPEEATASCVSWCPREQALLQPFHLPLGKISFPASATATIAHARLSTSSFTVWSQ